MTVSLYEIPLFSKISVLGEDQHPLYAQLTAALRPQSISQPH
jgi:glutathione peroxidase-family protein